MPFAPGKHFGKGVTSAHFLRENKRVTQVNSIVKIISTNFWFLVMTMSLLPFSGHSPKALGDLS